jgi:hypothetical protein
LRSAVNICRKRKHDPLSNLIGKRPRALPAFKVAACAGATLTHVALNTQRLPVFFAMLTTPLQRDLVVRLQPAETGLKLAPADRASVLRILKQLTLLRLREVAPRISDINASGTKAIRMFTSSWSGFDVAAKFIPQLTYASIKVLLACKSEER